MRYSSSIAVFAYVVVSAGWVYWLRDQQVFFGSDLAAGVELTLLVLANLAIGYLVGRAWAAALPFLPVLFAVPLGYPSGNLREPLPVWFGVLVVAPFAVMAVLIGVGARRLLERRKAASRA